MTKDRIVLGDVSWQFGLSLFVLGRFFLLGIGLGLCMKWAGVAEFFAPTRTNRRKFIQYLRYVRNLLEESFNVPPFYSHIIHT